MLAFQRVVECPGCGGAGLHPGTQEQLDSEMVTRPNSPHSCDCLIREGQCGLQTALGGDPAGRGGGTLREVCAPIEGRRPRLPQLCPNLTATYRKPGAKGSHPAGPLGAAAAPQQPRDDRLGSMQTRLGSPTEPKGDTGGEPTSDPNHETLLRKLPHSGMAHRVTPPTLLP